MEMSVFRPAGIFPLRTPIWDWTSTHILISPFQVVVAVPSKRTTNGMVVVQETGMQAIVISWYVTAPSATWTGAIVIEIGREGVSCESQTEVVTQCR